MKLPNQNTEQETEPTQDQFFDENDDNPKKQGANKEKKSSASRSKAYRQRVKQKEIEIRQENCHLYNNFLKVLENKQQLQLPPQSEQNLLQTLEKYDQFLKNQVPLPQKRNYNKIEDSMKESGEYQKMVRLRNRQNAQKARDLKKNTLTHITALNTILLNQKQDLITAHPQIVPLFSEKQESPLQEYNNGMEQTVDTQQNSNQQKEKQAQLTQQKKANELKILDIKQTLAQMKSDSSKSESLFINYSNNSDQSQNHSNDNLSGASTQLSNNNNTNSNNNNNNYNNNRNICQNVQNCDNLRDNFDNECNYSEQNYSNVNSYSQQQQEYQTQQDSSSYSNQKTYYQSTNSNSFDINQRIYLSQQPDSTQTDYNNNNNSNINNYNTNENGYCQQDYDQFQPQQQIYMNENNNNFENLMKNYESDGQSQENFNQNSDQIQFQQQNQYQQQQQQQQFIPKQEDDILLNNDVSDFEFNPDGIDFETPNDIISPPKQIPKRQAPNRMAQGVYMFTFMVVAIIGVVFRYDEISQTQLYKFLQGQMFKNIKILDRFNKVNPHYKEYLDESQSINEQLKFLNCEDPISKPIPSTPNHRKCYELLLTISDQKYYHYDKEELIKYSELTEIYYKEGKYQLRDEQKDPEILQIIGIFYQKNYIGIQDKVEEILRKNNKPDIQIQFLLFLKDYNTQFMQCLTKQDRKDKLKCFKIVGDSLDSYLDFYKTNNKGYVYRDIILHTKVLMHLFSGLYDYEMLMKDVNEYLMNLVMNGHQDSLFYSAGLRIKANLIFTHENRVDEGLKLVKQSLDIDSKFLPQNHRTLNITSRYYKKLLYEKITQENIPISEEILEKLKKYKDFQYMFAFQQQNYVQEEDDREFFSLEDDILTNSKNNKRLEQE